MKTLLASALFLALGMTAHADGYTVASPCGNPVCPLPEQVYTEYFYVNAYYQWQDASSGIQMEEFFVNIPEDSAEGAFVYGPVADFPAMDVLDPAQFPAGPGQSAPEPRTIPLLLCAMAVLIGFRKYVKTKVA